MQVEDRLDAIEAFLLKDVPPLLCPEYFGDRTCNRTVTTIVNLGDAGVAWTCTRCATAYLGKRRPITDTDRMWIHLQS